MKTLPAQDLQYGDYKQVLAAIDKLVWELVYGPVVDLVRPTLPKPVAADLAPRDLRQATAQELRNSADAEGRSALRKALATGTVQMVPQAEAVLFFVAKPDRRISDGLRSFGAKLDKRTGAWTCPAPAVPAWVRAESQGYAEKAKAANDAVKRLLDDLEERVDKVVEEANIAKAADHAVAEVAKGWKDSAKQLQVSWKLDDAGRTTLADGLARSAKIEIKGLAKEAIQRLRQQVSENATQGYRAESLAERIRQEYGVSKSRADLIASQETRNFMADFRKARALDAGLRQYVWWCVLDARTRPDHKRLHKQVFYYDHPPIVDQRTGRRGNPGQDFRCRCNDLPKLD